MMTAHLNFFCIILLSSQEEDYRKYLVARPVHDVVRGAASIVVLRIRNTAAWCKILDGGEAPDAELARDRSVHCRVDGTQLNRERSSSVNHNLTTDIDRIKILPPTKELEIKKIFRRILEISEIRK